MKHRLLGCKPNPVETVCFISITSLFMTIESAGFRFSKYYAIIVPVGSQRVIIAFIFFV